MIKTSPRLLVVLAVAQAAGCHPPSGSLAPPEVPAPPLPGRFVEIAGAAPFQFPPVDPQGQVDPPLTGGLFADLDGDGAPEVILTQVSASGDGVSKAYKYENGQLVPGPMLPAPGAVIAALDLDGDGHLDLVYGDAIHWGAGSAGYKAIQMPFTSGYVAALWDIDGNGLTDLITLPWCDTPHILLQMTPRHFTDRPDLIAPGPNIGSNAAFVGNVGGRLLLGTVGFGCLDKSADVPIFYAQENGVFKRIDLVPGLSFSRGAAMGASTGMDLDGDGLFDMLVGLNPQHEVVSKRREVLESFFDVPSDTGQPMIPWTALILDLDLDGRQDVLWTHGADTLASEQVSKVGKERTTGHWNSGHGFGRFATLGDLDRRGEWRILGAGDLDNDGDADVILGGFGEDPHVYRNDTQGNAVSLRILNKQGTPAYGATLKLVTPTITQIFEVAGIATQKMVNEPLVFAGLGTATEADLEVTWADGTSQHEVVKAGGVARVMEKGAGGTLGDGGAP